MPKPTVLQNARRVAMCQGNRLRLEGVYMSAERRRLDRGEIIGLIRDELKPWREEVREHQAKQDQTADKLLDGAQASIYTATILIGDSKLGIKGAIPEINERLSALESKGKEDDKRLDKIERNQKRILRSVRDWVLKDDAGHYSYPKVTTVIAAAVAVGTSVSSHASAWLTWIKKTLMEVTK